jgi:hypothetical protein
MPGIIRVSVMNYLRSFAPWIVYGVLSSWDWRIATVAAAIGAGALVVDQLRKRALDLLDSGTFTFFTIMAVVAIVRPNSGLHNWTWALSYGTLAIIAAGSLLIRRPFTLAMARRNTPREVWEAPLFLHANAVITGVWAVSFGATAVGCALIVLADHNSTLALNAVQIIGIVVPLRFTITYATRKRIAAMPRDLDSSDG